ncbi:MAG: porin [Sterolibacterium sp.]|nr:porin [Sterolibacterium sp.]
MKTKIIAASVCAAFGIAGMGHAQAETRFDVSGFGTLAATHSDNRDGDYKGGFYHPNGPGASDAWMYGVDTKAGVQLSANFGNGLTGIAQMVADHRGNNSYSPIFEWANLKYDINKNWYVRGGRVVLPTFMISDTRNIGFSQTSVRAPMEVYFINPITHVDGIDIGARYPIGDGNLSATLTLGKSKDIMSSYAVKGSGIKNLGLTYELNTSTFHANYMKGKISLVTYDNIVPGTTGKLNMYFNAARALQNIPAAGYPAPNLLIDNLDAKMWSLGYTYDPGTWIVQAEYAARKVDGALVPDLAGWYVQGGYRIGKFTPYLSASELKDKSPAMRSPASTTAGGIAAFIVNAGDQMMGNISDSQKVLSAGVRYDLLANLALKAQLDVIRKPGSVTSITSGSFTNATTAFETTNQTVKLFTVALDFVF